MIEILYRATNQYGYFLTKPEYFATIIGSILLGWAITWLYYNRFASQEVSEK